LIGLAQVRRRFHKRIEHGLQVEGRAADDLEHVGGCSLLLQRLTQLIEQPHILDRDDGLASEVCQKSDLFFGERPNLLAINGYCTDQLLFLEHWYADHRAGAGEIEEGRAS
jgi:hypothetical protein